MINLISQGPLSLTCRLTVVFLMFKSKGCNWLGKYDSFFIQNTCGIKLTDFNEIQRDPLYDMHTDFGLFKYNFGLRKSCMKYLAVLIIR